MASNHASSSSEQQTGWQRVAAVFAHALQPVDNPDQVPDPPAALVDWGKQTSLGIVAGMLLYGLKQSRENKQQGTVPVPGGMPTKLHTANYIAAEHTRRLAATLNQTVRGGLHVGGATGLFLGVRELAAIYQNRQDVSNTVFAAALTGGVFGLLVQGTARARIRSSLLMATLGAAAGYPTGMLHDKLAVLGAATDSGVPSPESPVAHEKADAVDAVVQTLRAGLEEDAQQTPRTTPSPEQQRTWWWPFRR